MKYATEILNIAAIIPNTAAIIPNVEAVSLDIAAILPDIAAALSSAAAHNPYYPTVLSNLEVVMAVIRPIDHWTVPHIDWLEPWLPDYTDRFSRTHLLDRTHTYGL